MKAFVDLSECLLDSPRFRVALAKNEIDINLLEIKLDKIIRLCNAMIDASKLFTKSQGAFINGIVELSLYFNDDNPVVSSLNRISQMLKELMQYNSVLTDQMNRAVSRNLINFVQKDVFTAKDTKRHFEKISEDLDNVLLKNSQCSKTKPNECEETRNLLTATKSCFQHTALDYVCQISCLQSKKRHEILDSLLSLMQAYRTYFHQGTDLFKDFDAFVISKMVSKMRDETNSLQKQLEQNHSLVNESTEIKANDASSTCHEGYLFKRTSNAFKTWNRRWFMIHDNKLIYQRRSENEKTVMEEDLRFCHVKPLTEIDRRFCFEVVSTVRHHILQADSEESCRQWISSLQSSINAAYNNSNHNVEPFDSIGSSASSSNSNKSSQINSNSQNPLKPLKAHLQILSFPGNSVCCECKAEGPKWASINLGITLCIECSGAHRSLGVHYSKVKSLILDEWDRELVKLMLSLGNDLVNSIYEEKPDENIKRPHSDSSPSEREIWIRAKYVERLFVVKDKFHQTNNNQKLNLDKENAIDKITHKNENSDNEICCEPEICEQDINFFNLMLYNASKDANIPLMCKALGKGADVNWVNKSDDSMVPLHKAVQSGSVPACEYLLLNGAIGNIQDDKLRSPLHLATELSNTGIVCLLLKKGSDLNLRDDDERNALEIAINNANADIVTLLRLAKLDEEMRNDECYNCGDQIFNEVVRDFSQMASNDPEKLKRNLD